MIISCVTQLLELLWSGATSTIHQGSGIDVRERCVSKPGHSTSMACYSELLIMLPRQGVHPYILNFPHFSSAREKKWWLAPFFADPPSGAAPSHEEQTPRPNPCLGLLQFGQGPCLCFVCTVPLCTRAQHHTMCFLQGTPCPDLVHLWSGKDYSQQTVLQSIFK